MDVVRKALICVGLKTSTENFAAQRLINRMVVRISPSRLREMSGDLMIYIASRYLLHPIFCRQLSVQSGISIQRWPGFYF